MVGVADEDDPRLERDIVARDPVRIALAVPALVVVADDRPEDAEGRVEFIVQPLPVRAEAPVVKKAKTKRKPTSPADVTPVGSVPWSIVAAIGVAMIVCFAIGALLTR